MHDAQIQEYTLLCLHCSLSVVTLVIQLHNCRILSQGMVHRVKIIDTVCRIQVTLNARIVQFSKRWIKPTVLFRDRVLGVHVARPE